MDKRAKIAVALAIALILIAGTAVSLFRYPSASSYKLSGKIAIDKMRSYVAPKLEVERILTGRDKDGDGIDDADDIVAGALAEVERAPTYKSAYYQGGYPPATEGVCTDVIWRALKDAGYDLKGSVDADIRKNTRLYPRVNGKPDPNIDFRRVPNLTSYFERYAQSLTLEIKPGDPENLKLWQGGDVVVYDIPYPHIGIVSYNRRNDGVPLLIHNAGPVPYEVDSLLSWSSLMTHHFRFPK